MDMMKYNLDTNDLLFALKEEIKYTSKEREKILKKELNNLKKLN